MFNRGLMWPQLPGEPPPVEGDKRGVVLHEGPGPPTAGDKSVVVTYRKIQPAVFRNVKVRDVLNGVLKDFDLMVMAGSIGQIRIVPKGLTKEELEELRRQDVESTRSDPDNDSSD